MDELKEFYRKHNKVIFYSAAFLMPFLLTLFLFAVRHIYPFGDITFLKKDMYQQYTPFFYEYYRKLKSGESLWYSWNAGLGANFFAVLVYYLASPLNLLIVLFPEKNILEFMSYSVVIKTGLMGLSCSAYLSNHFKRHDPAMTFFALCYAMSAYMAAYNWNVEWMDVLFTAPIVLLGLERIMEDKSPAVYYLSLSYAILTNYYLSIMLCIYTALYFIVLAILKGINAKRLINFTLFSILSGLTAAVCILPEYYALKFTTFTNIRFPKELKLYCTPLDIFVRHLMGVTPETGLEHYPNIYCGLPVLFMLCLYAISRKISLKEKICYLTLTAFMLLSFDINVLNFIWHGLNYPDSLPARQGYLYILLLLTLSYQGFLILRDAGKRAFYISLALPLISITIAVFLADKGMMDELSKTFTCVFSLSIAALCLFYRTAPDKLHFPGNGQELFFRYLILICLAFEIVLNMYYTNNRTVKRSDYFGKYDAFTALNNEKKALDAMNNSPLSRADEVFRNVRNDSMMIGYSSLSFFSSTSNGLLIKYLNKYGFMNSRVFYLSDGETALTSLLLGQRYVFVPEGKIYHGEDIASPYKFSNGAALYEFNDSLPNGYALHLNDEGTKKLFMSATNSEKIIDGELDSPNSGGSPIEAQNALIHDLNLSGTALMRYGSTDDGTINIEDNKISVTFNDDCHLYAYNAGRTKGELNISLSDGTSLGKMTANKYKYIFDLGYHPAGTSASIVSADKDDTEMDFEFYRLNENVLESFSSSVNSTERLENIVKNDCSLSGDIEMKSAGHLVLMIPYEPGWTLHVDGRETHIDLFDGLWISTGLSKGQHEIRLDFFPRGLRRGAVISILSLLISLFFLKHLYLFRTLSGSS